MKTLPEFELLDHSGETWTREKLQGSPTILYFYPKDDTPGCTTESCNFRDEIGTLTPAKVIGVSPDSVKSHQKFAKKFELPFPLLADTEKVLIGALGIWVEKTMYGKKYMGVERTTILLDAHANIVRIWNKVSVPGHVDEVKLAVAELLAGAGRA